MVDGDDGWMRVGASGGIPNGRMNSRLRGNDHTMSACADSSVTGECHAAGGDPRRGAAEAQAWVCRRVGACRHVRHGGGVPCEVRGSAGEASGGLRGFSAVVAAARRLQPLRPGVRHGAGAQTASFCRTRSAMSCSRRPWVRHCAATALAPVKSEQRPLRGAPHPPAPSPANCAGEGETFALDAQTHARRDHPHEPRVPHGTHPCRTCRRRPTSRVHCRDFNRRGRMPASPVRMVPALHPPGRMQASLIRMPAGSHPPGMDAGLIRRPHSSGRFMPA
jgi:hypothetical protein